MKVMTFKWSNNRGWEGKVQPFSKNPRSSNLVIVFGGLQKFKNATVLREINELTSNAVLIGCSTAGEIFDTQVSDETLSVVRVEFDKTRLISASVRASSFSTSFEAAKALCDKFPKEGLVHLFVISAGTGINGTELVRGLTANLPPSVKVTGGLAADAGAFQKTFVISDDQIENDLVAAVGFYGSELRVGYGSLGGWDSFGPERLVTRSHKNILYELDGKSALSLYKDYLGDQAKDLPGSALLFPLSIKKNESDPGIVRTVVGMDKDSDSLIFAGDIPQGQYARLMKANFDRLIDGAVGAAETSIRSVTSSQVSLAILISCVGRKLVLKQRIEEEVEGVRRILGPAAKLAGFYSNGEICPFLADSKCDFHNQTMTITTFFEE